jgi:hypothetical protein
VLLCIKMSAVKNLNLLSQQHPFHLVDPSPHPFMTSLAIFELVLGFLMNLHFFETGAFNLLFSLFVFCYCLFRWFSDIVLESTFEGHHTEKVQQGIKLGMLLFIVSEVMFFFFFFLGLFSLCSFSINLNWWYMTTVWYSPFNKSSGFTFIEYSDLVVFRC